MQMIDVVQKLREIASRSPEEIGRAITAAEAMSGSRPVAEAESKKPDYLDFDKDGDEKEPMTKALKDKEEGEDKKVDEDVSITLSGSDAVLAEILKLAGMIGAKTTAGSNAAPSPVTMAPSAPDPTLGMPTPPPPLPALGPALGGGGPDPMDEPLVEPMMDDAFNASTTPSPTTMSINSAIPAGNDLAKPKITTPMTSPGNNPMHTSISFD